MGILVLTEKLRPTDDPAKGGVKKDYGKLRMDLIPPEAMEAMAVQLTLGAQKYGERNWEKGMGWMRVFGGVLRHLFKWCARRPMDPDTKTSHLWGALIGTAFLVAYEARNVGEDDRPFNVNLTFDE